MADYFNMPTLGQSMEEGTVVQWFKKEGDSVRIGDKLVEIMSDKANFEVEAETEGTLRKILAGADEIVAINTPIAIIGTADESIDAMLNGSGAGPTNGTNAPEIPQPSAETVSAPAAASSAATPTGGRVFISPRARRIADEHGIAITALAGAGSGIDGRVVERDVLAYMEKQGQEPAKTADDSRTRITPLAARIADDLGVNVGDLALGLPGSRVTAEDVRRHAEVAKPSPTPAQPGTAGSGLPGVAEVIPFRGMRKIIADNVAKSRQTAPHVTLTSEVDMTEAAALYKKLVPEIQKSYNTKLTYTDILVKAAARALADHPLCNAALIGYEIRVYSSKNIGIAVASETGLMVPVLKNADTRPLGELSVELKALVERCRTGKQTGDDLSGGTFTITNLGAFGIDTFDPIIVPPQSCILGVCRIAQKPAVADGAIAIRSMMNICLSFDHRVLDGAPAARFVQRLKELLESPLLIFV
jgi:pyruvate dehydrogenase E2 component (dihydrolipoamide acetyltransferase)